MKIPIWARFEIQITAIAGWAIYSFIITYKLMKLMIQNGLNNQVPEINMQEFILMFLAMIAIMMYKILLEEYDYDTISDYINREVVK